MTIRHLKLYIAVYQSMNITKAAEGMNITQPTVTRAIQELEEHYGVRFFDRINKRLSATEAGSRFYAYATQTIEAYEHMEDGMFGWSEKEVIKIGSTISIGSVLLPGIISEFKEKYPDVQIKSYINNSEHIHEMLQGNQIDFAFMEGYVPTEHVLSEVLSEDRLVLLLPPNDPRCQKKEIDLYELENDAFLLREKGSVGRSYVDILFSSHGFPINPIMESVSTHAIVRAVNAGIGVSILPEELVKHSITSEYVGSCKIKNVNLVRQNYIVWHEGKYLTDNMKKLMELSKSISN